MGLETQYKKWLWAGYWLSAKQRWRDYENPLHAMMTAWGGVTWLSCLSEEWLQEIQCIHLQNYELVLKQLDLYLKEKGLYVTKKLSKI